MSDQYMKELLRVAVAQICQTIGYNATQSAPLELLQDVLDKFLKEFTRDLRRQVEHYNRTEANLNDVTLTLNSINVNLNELLDYINNVEPVPFALEVPKFPARKDSALNFLKPGSKEVLTRPVHVHDHLPPMLPPEITQPVEHNLNTSSSSTSANDSKQFQENLLANNNGETNIGDAANKAVNPSTVLDKSTLQSLFKPSTNFEDGERPTREVSSVVMTTGGYISPAVEGKMPEAIVPDIIDKLLGLDAPPPPTPPPPPPLSRPASRSANSTPGPSDNPTPLADKKLTEREIVPSTSKESKKQALARSLEPQPVTSKKLELLHDLPPVKKNKLFNPTTGKNYPPDNHHHIQPIGNYNKKSFMMHQNSSGMQTTQTNYANMLLKKAKKQKVPLMPGQNLNEKHNKAMNEKLGKLGKMDAAEKAHRKYMKMLQKMAKQGKIPPEVLNNIMGPDKKSKMINPAIVASMPPGPEKLQLEKLLRKQAKQRQKMIKQQIMFEKQKQSKMSMQHPPPLVPIFPQRMPEALQKPLHIDFEEEKHKMEPTKDVTNISPVKSSFMPNMLSTPSSNSNLAESLLAKAGKTPTITETPPMEIMEVTPKPLTTVDGKELKLNNEPDRSKLNIFKKISKQKTPKSSSSPTPMRMPGLSDNPIINLPSGTTITPTPGPSIPPNINSPLTPAPNIGRNLFPPLTDNPTSGGPNSNIINVDDIKEKPGVPSHNNAQQPTDLSMLNRVFGEKAPEVELVNKPKKRGRKPGSKNSPKIPGVFPNNLLKKNSKKMKMDNSSMFPLQQMPMQLPPEFAAAAGMGNLSFDKMAQLFGNPLNHMDLLNVQQQMMTMAGGKERKEHKKKNKLMKMDHLHSGEHNMPNKALTSNASLNVPTNEEVQTINKKLMRIDTILKPAPTSSSSSSTDLTIDTSLITGKKLPSPAMFPSSSTSPLKSPGNAKRLLAGAEAMTSNLVQPFILPNRPAFPNMLSMLPFAFTPQPGLIPTPGLFPTPGLGAFPNNPKNPLLPGLFPFPNLKQPMADNSTKNHDTEDLTTDKKKSELNSQTERSYCNVAPLVPDFLTKLCEQHSSSSSSITNKHQQEPPHAHEPDLPKTPKPRNSHSNTLTQDNLLKKMVDAHTPESAAGSQSGKSIPSTPGGMSLNTFEQLMKKNESPLDLMTLNKHPKSLSGSQESGLDFSMNKKSHHHNTNMGGGISIKTPITLNNEPIEVSDDSDETNQPPPPPVKSQPPPASHQPQPPVLEHKSFNMDDMFVANTGSSNMLTKYMDTDLSSKELKKLKKQVKKSSSSITNASLMATDKTEGLSGPTATAGVGKLAGGADLIPLSSTGMAYSSKNIPYNSLTANANPTFSIHKTDFNASNTTVSANTTPSASTSVFDNLTITAATIPSPTSASSSTAFDLQKKPRSKEHKKIKKLKELKEGKIKKKKDKKDKNKEKTKEKAEKYLQTQTQASPTKEKEMPVIELIAKTAAPSTAHNNSLAAHSSSSSSTTEKFKDKELIKKLKKEKKKEKQRTVLEELTPLNTSVLHHITQAQNTIHKEGSATSSTNSITSLEIEPPKRQKLSPLSVNTTPMGRHDHNDKPGSNSTNSAVPSASLVPKLTLKLGSTHSPTPPRDEAFRSSSTAANPVSAPPPPQVAASSPPREPSPELARISPLVTRPPKHKLNTSGELASGSSTSANNISAANASSLEMGDSSKISSTSNPNMIVPPPSPWLSGGTISASSVLLPHQLLQTTKQHDMTTTPTSATHNADNSSKNANTDRQSPLTLITETSRPSSYIDAEGNRVWICPACGKVDDGSPMIGCDGCDAWYHWVCVGIFVAPKDNEDWFCRVCITRKKGLHGSDKKRKRNKKK